MNLDSALAELAPNGFKSEPYYDHASDCVAYFVSGEMSVAEWIDGRVTIYRSVDRSRIVGIEITNVSFLVRALAYKGCKRASQALQNLLSAISFPK